MTSRNIVIWGAGKIGRGFIGDLFHAADYRQVFVDAAPALVESLRQHAHYPVIHASGRGAVETVTVEGYTALHTSEAQALQDELNRADLVAVTVFPKYFEEVAAELQRMILKRFETAGPAPLDILLCTNLIHAGPKFFDLLVAGLSGPEREQIQACVGIVETLIIRISPELNGQSQERHPLAVLTNGYPTLPVDRQAFKGEIPQVPSLRLVENMRAEEIRKIYTYNMCHALLAYHGAFYSYELLIDCLADARLMAEARAALAEISQALELEYGFTAEEMAEWVDTVIEHTNNDVVRDTAARSAADPLRKLKRDDRLLGPALLCLKHGIQPQALIRAIGAAFHYRSESDPESTGLQDLIQQNGIAQTAREVCGLTEDDVDLLKSILDAYIRVPIEADWAKNVAKARALGFEYEKVYHGCGQSVIAAVTETLDIFDETVFQAATGLCGGIGLVNDSTCSAYSGSVLVIGMVIGRSRALFGGARAEKYANYELCQRLRDKMRAEYGTTWCGGIHTKNYGRAYDLTDRDERELFEAAGAHDFGCTNVVGNCAAWTVELLAEVLIEREVESKMENRG